MKSRLFGAWLAPALLAAGIAGPAHAQDANYARSLAATCFACHGTDGRSVGGVPPSLAGQDKDDLLQALKDFKAGKRPATVMHQHAQGLYRRAARADRGLFRGREGRFQRTPAPSARGGN